MEPIWSGISKSAQKIIVGFLNGFGSASLKSGYHRKR